MPHILLDIFGKVMTIKTFDPNGYSFCVPSFRSRCQVKSHYNVVVTCFTPLNPAANMKWWSKARIDGDGRRIQSHSFSPQELTVKYHLIFYPLPQKMSQCIVALLYFFIYFFLLLSLFIPVFVKEILPIFNLNFRKKIGSKAKISWSVNWHDSRQLNYISS